MRFDCTAPLVVRGPSALVHACCIDRWYIQAQWVACLHPHGPQRRRCGTIRAICLHGAARRAWALRTRTRMLHRQMVYTGSVGSAHAPTRAPAASLWHHSCDLIARRRSSCVGPPHSYTHAASTDDMYLVVGYRAFTHTCPSGVAVAPFVGVDCTAPIVVRGPSALVHASCID